MGEDRAPSLLHRLDRLQAVLRRLGALRDLGRLYTEAAREATDFFAATQCGIALYDTASGAFRDLAGATGVGVGQIQVLPAVPAQQIAQFLARWPAHGVIRLSAPEDVALIAPALAAKLPGSDGLLALMRGEDELIGVLRVASHAEGVAFSPDDSHLLGLFANQLGILIQNQAHLERVERHGRELSLLNEVAGVLNSALGLGDFLDRLLEQLKRAFNFERASIGVLEGSDLVTIAASGFAKNEEIVGQRRPWDRYVLNSIVIQTGTPLSIPDVKVEPRWQPHAAYAMVRTWLGIPLRRAGRTIGLLIITASEPGVYSSDDERLLIGIADQVAIALENTRLYRVEQERAQELAKANEELKALDRMKDEFVQTVSHELRTPLTFIKGYVELLLEGVMGDLTFEQADALRIITQRTENITHLVNDIISLARVDAMGLTVQRVSLVELADGATQSARAVATQLGLELITDFPEDPLLVCGDIQRLSQVFDNLIGNAVKFSSPGGKVWVRVRADGEFARAEVIDQGVGIPADKLERVWERFYQVDGTITRRFGGTGLGLAIVKRIVESQGGQVGACSVVGQGSTFFFTAPRTDR